MKESCKNCRFLFVDDALEAIGEGVCRRNPPVVLLMTGQTTFPQMKADIGWCGEHQPKTQQTKTQRLKVRK